MHGQFSGLTGHNAIGTTTIEIAVEDEVSVSSLITDDTTVAVATLSMTNGEVL